MNPKIRPGLEFGPSSKFKNAIDVHLSKPKLDSYIRIFIIFVYRHMRDIYLIIYIYTCRCRWVCVCLGVRLYLDNPPSILWSWIQPSPSGFHMFIPIHLSSGPIPNEIIHWVASRDNLQFYTGCSGFYRIGPNCRGLWNQPEFHPDQFQKFKILVMAKCGGCVGF